MIDANQIKQLGVRRMLTEHNLLKTAAWGHARDARLLQKVGSLSSLYLHLSSLNVVPHQGFIRGHSEQQQPVDWSLVQQSPARLEEITHFQPFALQGDKLPLFSDGKLQWPRSANIYRGPLLLIHLGVSSGGIQAAICEQNVVYSQRYYGLQIPDEHAIWRSCLN
ncbi:MAG: hypothetical protein HC794_08065, partial [Nitrospiraceae bacterium]|nr:hypothetical protein [Nitrospiraceae bacterium]